MSDLRAAFSDLAVEMEKHSNDHIHDKDGSTSMCAAVEGVCADRINVILKHAPDLAALEAQFREKAVELARRLNKHSMDVDKHSLLAARAVLALHAEVEKRKGGA